MRLSLAGALGLLLWLVPTFATHADGLTLVPGGVRQLAEFSRKTHSRLFFWALESFVGYVDNGEIRWVVPPRDVLLPASEDRRRSLNRISPAVSPDGRRVVFSNGSDTLSVCDVESTECEDVKGDDPVDVAWLPDGGSLVFRRGDRGFVVYLLSSRSSRDIKAERKVAFEDGQYYPDGNWAQTVSPDGRFLAFDMNRRVQRGDWTKGVTISSEYSVCVMDLSEGVLRRLEYGRYAGWNPATREITYDNQEDGIYAIRPDGSGRRKLFPYPTKWVFGLIPGRVAADYPLIWSRDGSHVLLQQVINDYRGGDIFDYDIKTRKTQRLVHDAALWVISWN